MAQPQQVDYRVNKGQNSEGDKLGSDEVGGTGNQGWVGKPQPRTRLCRRLLNPTARVTLNPTARAAMKGRKRLRDPPLAHGTPAAGSRRRRRPSPDKRAKFDPYDRAKRTPGPPDMILPKLNGTYSMDIDTQHGDKNMGNSQKG